jgi:hypothetical protein
MRGPGSSAPALFSPGEDEIVGGKFRDWFADCYGGLLWRFLEGPRPKILQEDPQAPVLEDSKEQLKFVVDCLACTSGKWPQPYKTFIGSCLYLFNTVVIEKNCGKCRQRNGGSIQATPRCLI